MFQKAALLNSLPFLFVPKPAFPLPVQEPASTENSGSIIRYNSGVCAWEMQGSALLCSISPRSGKGSQRLHLSAYCRSVSQQLLSRSHEIDDRDELESLDQDLLPSTIFTSQRDGMHSLLLLLADTYQACPQLWLQDQARSISKL